jgi:hypothetical protein
MKKIIEYNEITKDALAEIFGIAAIGCEVDNEDDELYLTDGIEFPVRVIIDNERKSIKIFTFLETRDGAPNDELPLFAQKLNDKFVTTRFTASIYDDDRAFINGEYYFYTNFGLIIPQFIYTVKKVAEIFVDAIREYDNDEKFFE